MRMIHVKTVVETVDGQSDIKTNQQMILMFSQAFRRENSQTDMKPNIVGVT